jgi:hypothetical protein
VCDTLPHALLPALLVSLTPESLSSAEPCEPPALAGDKLITRAALLQSWPQAPAPVPRALIIRTRPNGPDKCVRDYQQQPAPYLTPSAARLLVERGIEHLVLDIPSADRADDGGRLSAHRVFFGLPPGSQALAEARRAHCTITELAFIPDVIADGCWLLALQVPRIAGDALPSQPLLYAARAVGTLRCRWPPTVSRCVTCAVIHSVWHPRPHGSAWRRRWLTGSSLRCSAMSRGTRHGSITPSRCANRWHCSAVRSRMKWWR